MENINESQSKTINNKTIQAESTFELFERPVYNYILSDYITLAFSLKLSAICDAIDDEKEREDVQNMTIELAIKEAQSILNSFKLGDFFDLYVKRGYHKGFTICIENLLPSLFKNYEQKQEAQREITLIKKCLIKLVKECGLLEYYPYWRMGYATKEETLQDIIEAIKVMRKEVDESLTEYQYYKSKSMKI